MRYLLLPLALLTLTGCATFLPSAAQLKALSDRDRSWCVSVVVPGMGSGRASGTGIKGGTVKCSIDSMDVTTTAPLAE